jgi:virulence-associated protein VapD
MEGNIWCGRCIKLRKYEVNNLYPSISVIIKLRRMQWVEHVACIHGTDEKCMRKIGRQIQRKISYGKTIVTRKNNNKTYLTFSVCECGIKMFRIESNTNIKMSTQIQ